MMKSKLQEMTKAELYDLAKEHNVPGRSKMTKTELVKALSRIQTKARRTSRKLLVPEEREPERAPEPALEERGVGEPSRPTSPPPRPSAPQYLTPPPVERYQGDEGPPLPAHLPVTVLEAMPRDPHWVFLYWEISSEERERIASQYGAWIFERSLPLLRVHDVDAGVRRDVPVLLDARNWYLPVMPNRSYQFELALMIPSGESVVLASSRKIQTPAAEPVLEGGEEWLAVEEYFRELIEAYGEFAPGAVATSPGRRHLERPEGARIGWSAVVPITPPTVRR